MFIMRWKMISISISDIHIIIIYVQKTRTERANRNMFIGAYIPDSVY